MVAEGSFDARLYSAISQIQLRVPSLREHPEDVPELAKLILERCVEAKEVPPRQFSTARSTRCASTTGPATWPSWKAW